jgi:hypothetical protein
LGRPYKPRVLVPGNGYRGEARVVVTALVLAGRNGVCLSVSLHSVLRRIWIADEIVVFLNCSVLPVDHEGIRGTHRAKLGSLAASRTAKGRRTRQSADGESEDELFDLYRWDTQRARQYPLSLHLHHAMLRRPSPVPATPLSLPKA